MHIMLTKDLSTIGNKLFSYRKSRGLTQEQAAEKASVSQRTYADIERGKINMRLSTLISICNALEITPNDLLSAESEAVRINYTQLFEELNSKDEKIKEDALSILNTFLKSAK